MTTSLQPAHPIQAQFQSIVYPYLGFAPNVGIGIWYAGVGMNPRTWTCPGPASSR